MQKCDILFGSRSLGRGPGVAIFFGSGPRGEGEISTFCLVLTTVSNKALCREQTLPLAFVLHSASHQSVAAPHVFIANKVTQRGTPW